MPNSAALAQFLPIILIIGVFYLLLLRPQQKKANAHRDMLAALRRGDRVVTAGGILGLVTKVDEAEVTVEIAENVRVKVVRATIADVRAKTEPRGDGGAKAPEKVESKSAAK